MPNDSPNQNLANREKEIHKHKKESPLSWLEVEKKPLEKAPEKISEARPESEKESLAIGKEEPKQEILRPGSQISAKIIKSQTLKDIEDIMEEDLGEIYFNLPAEKRVQFKQRGEETATKIEAVLSQVKIKVSQILNLIKEWLKLIPGVNKFFLEQEAKIKTDKILQLRKDANQPTKDLDVDI